MASTDTEEGWLALPDGLKLYTKTWKPNGALKARLVFLHGFSDHCNWYPELFPALAERGIKVYSFDQRGWGRSVHEPRQKGDTGGTPQVNADITSFIRSLPSDDHNTPLFLMGHSMGGGETMVYAATGPNDVVGKIRGFLLESPLIALADSLKPWKATVILGNLASKIAPRATMVRKLDPSSMCRDPVVCQKWLDDPLNHDTATLETLAAITQRSTDLEDGKILVKEGLGEGGSTRLWVGHGTVDRACSFDATRKWYETLKLEDKEFRVYEGWYHKLHSEPGEDQIVFANDVAKWILDRCESLDNTPKSKL
jgi:acylglycerol lipase